MANQTAGGTNPVVVALLILLPIAVLAGALLLGNGCRGGHPAPTGPEVGDPVLGKWERQRRRMVATQMRDVKDPEVLAAMGRVPRHLFVPPAARSAAYKDGPLRIGRGQTISQPYIVARMTEAADVTRGDRVLEVGTGSGYQAAVLADLGCKVWSIEIIPELHRLAATNLEAAGYTECITLRCGDGYAGWPEEAPFDAILVTAAPPAVPEALKSQLRPGGRLVIPVGPEHATQKLMVITRTADGFSERTLFPVRFVPMVPKD